MSHQRPTWDEYFLEIMDAVAKRSTCDRGRVGCVIVKDKRILTTGYAGAPTGLAHCDEVGHEIHTLKRDNGVESEHCLRTVHAEMNAVVHAAKVGVSLDGATLYLNMAPCYACAKVIINAGIVRVVSRRDYQASDPTKAVLHEAHVVLELLDARKVEYENQ